jgi:hypothetical protein
MIRTGMVHQKRRCLPNSLPNLAAVPNTVKWTGSSSKMLGTCWAVCNSSETAPIPRKKRARKIVR